MTTQQENKIREEYYTYVAGFCDINSHLWTIDKICNFFLACFREMEGEEDCCEKCIKHPKSDLVCKGFCDCHHNAKEKFCVRCGMSNLEKTGFNGCNVYGINYGKHNFIPRQEKECCKYHCRCMNLDKSCPKPHFMDKNCICPRPENPKFKDNKEPWWAEEFARVFHGKLIAPEYKDILRNFIRQVEEGARKDIYKKWLSLDLNNSQTKEEWDRELTKFSLYLQALNELNHD